MAFDASIEPEDRDRVYIQKARDRLAAGWCQSKAYEPRGDQVCLVSALVCGMTGARVPEQALFDEPAINRLCGKLGFTSAGEAIRFNDWPPRTKAEVLERMDCYLENRPQRRDMTPDYMMGPGPGCQCNMCQKAGVKAGFYVDTGAAMKQQAAMQVAAYQAAYDKLMADAKPFFIEPAPTPQKSKGLFSLLTI